MLPLGKPLVVAVTTCRLGRGCGRSDLRLGGCAAAGGGGGGGGGGALASGKTSPPWQPGRRGLMQLAHAYLLSARGAARLAEAFLPVAFPSDFMLSQLLTEGGGSGGDGGGGGGGGGGAGGGGQAAAPFSVWWPSPGLVGQASIEGQGPAASSMQLARIDSEKLLTTCVES